MPPFWTVVVNSVAVPLVVACGSTYVTFWLASRRFRSERWWDRRAGAYQQIIEALHHVKRGTENRLDDLEHQPTGDQEQQDQLRARYRAGWDEILKAIDVASFLLPRAAQDALDTLMKEVNKADEGADAPGFNVYDAYRARFDAIRKCLGVLPDIAKKDLSVA